MDVNANDNAVDMSSKTLNAEENRFKKRKLSDEIDSKNDSVSLHKSFKGFFVKNILNEDITTKTIFVEGNFDSVEGKAVLILEKLPFGKEGVRKILTDETTLVNNFNNSIYGSYSGFPKAELNGIKATIIHPATEKHIEKYQFQPLFVIRETPEIHYNVVAPYVESQQLSLDWVYNILDHKSEVERIVFEDPDPDKGFILIPDLKWDGVETSNLYLIALCHRRGIKSIRDLTAEHLPLLKNVYQKAVKAISEKYNLPKFKLRAYLHYLPSYYHLHIHFTNVEYSAPGIQPERAHLLDTVINHLELKSDYYQKSTLIYCVKENDPLYDKLKSFGALE